MVYCLLTFSMDLPRGSHLALGADPAEGQDLIADRELVRRQAHDHKASRLVRARLEAILSEHLASTLREQ